VLAQVDEELRTPVEQLASTLPQMGVSSQVDEAMAWSFNLNA
jgi:hypothetical protein